MSQAQFFLTIVGLLGLCVGSFLNVLIHRLPQSISDGDGCLHTFYALCAPSRCPSCFERVRPQHNIPVFGFIALKGRSACCKTPISLRYPVIELVTALLSILIAWLTGPDYLVLTASLAFLWIMLTASVIDIESMLLPDVLTLPLIAIGMLFNFYDGFVSFTDSLFGTLAGYGILWLLSFIHLRRTGQEGMGQGDFKLMAGLGAWFGWAFLPTIFIISGLVSLVVAITLKAEKTTRLPFGPYLSLAGLVLLLSFLSGNSARLSIL